MTSGKALLSRSVPALNQNNGRKAKRYLHGVPWVHLLFLPAYAPEYNPVERERGDG